MKCCLPSYNRKQQGKKLITHSLFFSKTGYWAPSLIYDFVSQCISVLLFPTKTIIDVIKRRQEKRPEGLKEESGGAAWASHLLSHSAVSPSGIMLLKKIMIFFSLMQYGMKFQNKIFILICIKQFTKRMCFIWYMQQCKTMFSHRQVLHSVFHQGEAVLGDEGGENPINLLCLTEKKWRI